jgi:hypothetical protein
VNTIGRQQVGECTRYGYGVYEYSGYEYSRYRLTGGALD